MKTQTLQHQFRLWTILLVVVPSLLIMVIYSIGQIKTAKQEKLELVSQRIQFQERLIDFWMTERAENVRELGHTAESRTLDEGQIEGILYEKQKHDKNFDSLSYIDKDGDFKISTLSSGIQYPSAIGTPYFQAAQSGKEYISDVVIGRNSGQAIINFSYPVYGDTGNFQGLILGSVKTTTLGMLLSESWIGHTGEVLLVNREGTMITPPRNVKVLIDRGIPEGAAPMKLKITDDALLNIRLGETGTATWIDYLGNKVLGAYLDIPERGWTIIGKIDEGEVLASIYTQLVTMAGVTIFCVLLILPLATSIANQIKKPIEWLIGQSNLVATADYGMVGLDEYALRVPHELGALCKTFVNMSHKIEKTIGLLQENEGKLESKVIEIQNINKRLEEEIVEKQRIFQELSNSEADNRALVEAIPDGLLRISAQGEVLGAKLDNKKISSSFTEKQLIGRNLIAIIPDCMKELFTTTVAQALATGELQKKEYEIVNDGITWYREARIVPTRDDAIVAVIRDITEQKKAEGELVTMRDAMMNAQRMALLGVVAGSIAHDINQPLNSIQVSASGLLYLMKNGINISAEDYQRELSRIVNEGRRIDNVISKTLDIVRGVINYKEPLLMDEVLNSVLALIKEQELFKNIKIDVQIAPQQAWIAGNHEQIDQALLHILTNAGQALQDKQLQEKVIHISIQVADQVRLSVADNGPGLDTAIIDKLFEPFFTTGRTKQNMGLGLPIVQSIVYAHGGEIIAENNQEGGATFRVSFPRFNH